MKTAMLSIFIALSLYKVEAVHYTRWGRTSCPTGAAIIYTGYAGGPHWNHPGEGANTVCLPEQPEFDVVIPGHQAPTGWVSGAVYGFGSGGYSNNNPFSYANNNGGDVTGSSAPCVVCFRSDRTDAIMIPAKKNCPVDGMNLEYKGYLVSSGAQQYRSENICLDGTPEVVTGKPGHDHDGLYLYPVETGGWSLNDPPYQDGYELNCVVCTI